MSDEESGEYAAWKQAVAAFYLDSIRMGSESIHIDGAS